MARKAKVLYATEEDQIKFLRKKGSIVTFKEPFYPRGTEEEGRRQIIVSRLEKDHTGAAKIIGNHYDSPGYNSLDDLLKAIDWVWMRAAHQDLPASERRRKGPSI